MKCEDLLKMLNDYVDGDIDPAFCEQFAQHLQGCNPCQVVVDTIRKTITLYKEEGVYEMPLEFRRKLHDTLQAKWKERQTSSGCGPRREKDGSPHAQP